ncbi:hypothetical protein ABI59_23345 [Acidobacteria bacterium Mor1]|nr:hypothetical protein ABI59_23345 [Acidobacteria bacterium Mor1]
MRPKNDLPQRFARHLSGELGDEERDELERAAFDDDALFDELSAIESDLVDSYVRGELDDATGRGIAAMLETSPRMQTMAETTMALQTWRGAEGAAAEGRAVSRPSKPVAAAAGERVTPATTDRPLPNSSPWIAGGLLLLAVIGWMGWRQINLQAELDAADAQRQELTEQVETLRDTLGDLEDQNRNMARRLTRLEAGQMP